MRDPISPALRSSGGGRRAPLLVQQLSAVLVLALACIASAATAHRIDEPCEQYGQRGVDGQLINTYPPELKYCETPSPSRTPSELVTNPPVVTPTPIPPTGQPTGTVPPEDTRMLAPEDFDVVEARGTKLVVAWTYPSGSPVEPTFFRVGVNGEEFDFAYAGPGEYQEEVDAWCGQTNYVTLDAYNTDVEPEAHAQAEKVPQVEPDC